MEQQEQADAVQLPMTPEATSAVVAVRYAVDAEFRAAFDKDPKAALSQFSGQELPTDVEIVVHRNEDKRWNITLPAQQAEGALDDEDIENVAGGFGHPLPDAAQRAMSNAVSDGVAAGLLPADSSGAHALSGFGLGVPSIFGPAASGSGLFEAGLVKAAKIGRAGGG